MEMKRPENVVPSIVTDNLSKAGNSLNDFAQQSKTVLSGTTEQVKETFIKNTNQVFETLNSRTQEAYQTLSNVTQNVQETANNAANTISKSAETARNTISQTTNNAANIISESAETARNTISQTTSNAASSINAISNQAISNVNEVTEKTKASLEETLQQAQAVNHALSQSIQTGINSLIHDWISAHPFLFWMMSHPLYSFIILLLTVLLLAGLFRAISSLTAGFWIQMLTAPLKLLTSIGKLTVGSAGTLSLWGFRRFSQPQDQQISSQEKISQIFSRLEAIKQEQDQLLQELSTLLHSK
jgi:phage-related protein